MNGRRLGRWILLALFFSAAPVRAQPADAATTSTARALAEEGLSHFDGGRWQAALEKFDRADALIHAPTMSLLVARCLEKLGRLVEANERYVAAARSEAGPGASDAFKEAVADADKEQKVLLPRIPRLKVEVRGAVPAEAGVTLDGKPLPAAMIGVERLTDPGAHTLRGTRGGEVVERKVDLKEGQSQTVTLELAGGGDAGASPSPGSIQRTLGWVTIAVGGAGLVASGVTLGMGLGAKSDLVSTSKCSTDLVCPASAADAVSSYRTLRVASAGTFVGGAVALVVGVVVLATAPSSRSDAKAAAWYPFVGPDRVGIEGAF